MRPNTLVEGTVSKTEPIVRALSRCAAAPLRCWDGVPPSPRPATLLLRDVDTLDLREQQALIEWLGDRAGATRVIATSAVPLFPLVERGVILAELYYRLNIFRLEVS